MVASYGKANGADAGIEVEDVFGSDMLFDFCEGELVDRKVDLKEAIRGVAILARENSVGEGRKIGVRAAVFVETAGDLAGLGGA